MFFTFFEEEEEENFQRTNSNDIFTREIFFFFPRLIPSLKNPDLSSEIILSRIFDIKKKRKRDKFVAI